MNYTTKYRHHDAWTLTDNHILINDKKIPISEAELDVIEIYHDFYRIFFTMKISGLFYLLPDHVKA